MSKLSEWIYFCLLHADENDTSGFRHPEDADR